MKHLVLIAALMAAAAPGVAQAQYGADMRSSFGAGRADQDDARAAVRAGRQAPLSQVLSAIAQRTPGRHLNTTQGSHNGRPAYFVQWQTPGGQVIIFIADAESGTIIGRQGG
ncbi:MAG: hypothetical protein Q7V15_08930 [Phenylobacterium sp.]|uniref:PepSY domain-containing protein n=1 Tax=Phenylobacterium sp. TaxID=1871053 RepID=UPI002725E5B8|nr:hypothetical protein [Phenylobacterium sp.]MDO8901464.1 hypothetical protein [Phenylobacterium sp.]MDP2215218.1 hypothetical protein [Phenylobacterium sp.]